MGGEELGERDAARWLDDNGHELPDILMGRTLGSGPTPRPPSMRREDDIPASRTATESTGEDRAASSPTPSFISRFSQSWPSRISPDQAYGPAGIPREDPRAA